MKSSNGEVCPYCGSSAGIVLSERAIGWVKRYMEWSGEVIDTNFDKLREHRPKSGVCVNCDRRVVAPPEQG